MVGENVAFRIHDDEFGPQKADFHFRLEPELFFFEIGKCSRFVLLRQKRNRFEVAGCVF